MYQHWKFNEDIEETLKQHCHIYIDSIWEINSDSTLIHDVASPVNNCWNAGWLPLKRVQINQK